VTGTINLLAIEMDTKIQARGGEAGCVAGGAVSIHATCIYQAAWQRMNMDCAHSSSGCFGLCLLAVLPWTSSKSSTHLLWVLAARLARGAKQTSKAYGGNGD